MIFQQQQLPNIIKSGRTAVTARCCTITMSTHDSTWIRRDQHCTSTTSADAWRLVSILYLDCCRASAFIQLWMHERSWSVSNEL